MANLSVTYCGVPFKNPLVLASATPGWNGESMKLAAEAGIGGVIPKTIGPSKKWAAHPRNGRFFLFRSGSSPIGMINLELFTTKTRKEWLERGLPLAKQGGAAMQVSILALPDPEDTAELAGEIEKTGLADLFELNVSCPMPSSGVGMFIGRTPSLLAEQVKAVKAASSLPVTVKLTPNVSDMVEIAKAAKEAGADGLTISNSVKSFAGVDIETGKPYLRGYGGYTGPAIRPIILYHLSSVAREVDLPLSAVGGVQDYRDVIEYIMLGATTVQLATSVMWKGYGVIGRILRDLEAWMDKKGIQSLDEIRGIALSDITTVEELAQEPPLTAKIDPESCIGCGKCRSVCFYQAIKQDGKTFSADPSRCDGCGACAQWCPVHAIDLTDNG